MSRKGRIPDKEINASLKKYNISKYNKKGLQKSRRTLLQTISRRRKKAMLPHTTTPISLNDACKKMELPLSITVNGKRCKNPMKKLIQDVLIF